MTSYFQSLIDSNFATGVMHYVDAYPGYENLARIVVTAVIEGGFQTQFVIDTGSPWCVLNPELSPFVQTFSTESYAPKQTLNIRGISYKGCLHRMSLRLCAEQGNDLEIEATVFIPTLSSDQPWVHPNFIGLDGFLSRIRFAIDPAEYALYFGGG